MPKTPNRIAATLLAILASGPAAAFTVVPMTDPTGATILDALGFSGASHVDYRGVTGSFNAQAGLFSDLRLQGKDGTELAMSAGVIMTSGSAVGIPSTNTVGWYSNVTDSGASAAIGNITAGFGGGSKRGKDQLDSFDANELSFRFDAPAAARGISMRFIYASEEYPEFAGTMFADGFAVEVNGSNYALLQDGTPVSLLTPEANIHFLPNGDHGFPGAPQITALEYDGFTRILELRAPLDPGAENRITIAISDTGDQIYDSAVFLERVRFLEDPDLVDPGKGGFRHVKLSDDRYVEFEVHSAPVPEPETWATMLLGLGLLARRRRSR